MVTSPRGWLLPALAAAALLCGLPAPSRGEPKKPPLPGTTYDYVYDGKDGKHPERAWLGRAFVHRRAASDKPLPVLIFIHGLNSELIKYRWMGGGAEGDVRRIVADMIDRGDVPPMIVAGPSSIVPASVTIAPTCWPEFDLDGFLERTAARLEGVAKLDRDRIVVAGHSGGGCNDHGGLATALHAKAPILAALAIDTCMTPSFADQLASAAPSTHVVVSWQTMSWAKRPFAEFQTRFQQAVAKAKPNSGVVRELDRTTPTEPSPHDAMVHLTLEKWLPRFLGAGEKVN